MKIACLTICLATISLVAFSPAQDKKGARPIITTPQIQSADVTGQLDVPLGTCVPIRATIVRSQSGTKAAEGRFFLNVTHVQNRQLRSPTECGFYVHQFATENVKLAIDNFALHKLVTGRAAKSLTSEQVAELEKGYVGKSVTLIVYETGGFRGMPNGLPKGVSVWQDYGFGFSTQLLVMDQH
jgi:hypothetical protein